MKMKNNTSKQKTLFSTQFQIAYKVHPLSDAAPEHNL